MRLIHTLLRLTSGALVLAGAMLAQETITLNQAVSEALEKNLALLADRANIAIAEAQIITARLRPNPELTMGGNHLDLVGTGFNDINGGGPSEINLHTDFTIERGGKRQARIEVAQAARSVAELQFLDAARALTLDVQNAFVDVLLAKSTLALARENFEAASRIVDVNAARLKAGDIAEVELIRARLAALQFETAVKQSELRVRTALTRLQTTIGRTRTSPGFDASGELRRDSAVPALEEVHKLAAELRPDLRALERDTRRAAAELRLQTAQGKGDVTFGTEYVRQQYNASANSLGFEIGLPLPFFNRNQGEIARAGVEQRQAELRMRALQASIAGEVEEAWQQASTARELLAAIEDRMLQQARDVRQITQFSYTRGEATLLELLDAQRAFNETMQAYNEARAEYARSLYALDSTSGKAVTK